MGFNSTLLILNDYLGDIRSDTKLGELLATALGMSVKGDAPQPIGHGVYAIETHHADEVAIIAVGGNTARVIAYIPTDNPNDDAKVAVELSKWKPLELLLHARKEARKDAKTVRFDSLPPESRAAEAALTIASNLLSVEELNTLAKKKGFRLITLRRKDEKPKRLTKKGK